MKTQQSRDHTTSRIQMRGQRLVSAPEMIDPERSSKSKHTGKYPRENMRQPSLADADALAIMLGQLVSCLGNRDNASDVDVLSFSLHHLFHCVDFLYSKALPNFASCTSITVAGEAGKPGSDEVQILQEQDAINRPLLDHQCIWAPLQMISRTLHRLEPICHLLSDAIEGILDTPDSASEMISTEVIDQEQWDRAFNALSQSLKDWQQNYSTCVPFASQFRSLSIAFTTLLDGASMIFGDILPASRTLSPGDDQATATLLFDLIHQSDHLLVQLDATLEPLNLFIEENLL